MLGGTRAARCWVTQPAALLLCAALPYPGGSGTGASDMRACQARTLRRHGRGGSQCTHQLCAAQNPCRPLFHCMRLCCMLIVHGVGSRAT